jgi:non-ribosomal peptide synthetase component F
VNEGRTVPAPASGSGGTVTGHVPQLAGRAAAPRPRTLVRILQDTAAHFPDASALDDGRTALSYADLVHEVKAYARRLRDAGIGAGDKVGIRIPSGTNELYIAILAVLFAGAAYVPVDADDPDERARLVFEEAGVAGVLRAGEIDTPPARPRSSNPQGEASPDDDAWVIFTRPTGSLPASPSPSTPPVRRCGWHGAMGPAWYRRRVLSCGPEWTWDPG